MARRSWRVALRMAHRTARRSIGRTVLVAALIGLPVLAASWIVILTSSTNPSGAPLARQKLGTADATITVTKTPRITVQPAMADPTNVSYRSDPEQDGSRDPARVNIAALLPSGSKVVAAPYEWTSAVTLKVRDTTGNYPIVGLDGRSRLTAGMYRLDAGRLPTGPGEVALSPSLADHLGLREGRSLIDGAAVQTADGHSYPVVGLARRPDRPNERYLWGLPRSPLVPVSPDADLTYLVGLPRTSDPLALQQRLAAQGIALTPRSWVIDPPGGPQSPGDSDARAIAATALVIGFGVVEIVLLAGTAFAVSARRQTREYGLVLAAGGNPQDIRRIVLAQGLALGLIGTAAGATLAIVAAVLGRPGWERTFNHLIDDWIIPVVPLVVMGLLALLAAMAAAVVPAITAGRQQPMAALTGRFSVRAGNRRYRSALVLLLAGITSVLIGDSMLGSEFEKARQALQEDPNLTTRGIAPPAPLALVLIGISTVIAAMVWLLPTLMARVAMVGRRLPVSGRLALRDAARHRHRTGPAAAAIMISVGGTVAMAFAVANASAAEAERYVPSTRDGNAVVRFSDSEHEEGPRLPTYSLNLIRRLEQRLPARGHVDLALVEAQRRSEPPYRSVLGVTEPIGAGCGTEGATCGSLFLRLIAVDPEYVEQLGSNGPEVAAVLRSGQVAVSDAASKVPGSPPLVRDGKITVKGHDDVASTGVTLPASLVAGLPRLKGFQSAVLISPETARKLGSLKVIETHFDLTRSLTGEEQLAAAAELGAEGLLTVEDGYTSRAGTASIALVSAATAVTLLGVAISVALSSAEGRADFATLAAVGAQPRQRRKLAAAQAWLLAQLGCVLGVLIGGLYGYTAHVVFASPHFAIPWRDLGGILIAVPLFAGALAWLATRSHLPTLRRLE
ncbi:ABC transporter permease [Kribbella swartbergensis]